MEELTKLRRERGFIRTSITTAINKSEEIVKSSRVRDNEATLLGLSNLLKTKLNSIDSVDHQILHLLPEAEVAKDQTDAASYQESVYVCLAQIEKALLPVPSPASSQNMSQTSSSKFNVKLPKLSIETFDGSPLKFQSFLESFQNSVDSNENLSKNEKFLYLKGLLKGQAAKAIEGLTVSQENYESALEIIKSRFGKTKLLIATHVDALLKIKPVLDSRNVQKLRGLFDDLETHIRNLRSLGINSDDYGPVLIPCLINKLPEDIRLDITKHMDMDTWNLNDLVSSLNTEISNREACLFVSTDKQVKQEVVKSRERERGNFQPHTTSSLYKEASSSGNKDACVFCSGVHKSWNAKLLLTLIRGVIFSVKILCVSIACALGTFLRTVSINSDAITVSRSTIHPFVMVSRSRLHNPLITITKRRLAQI